MCDKHIILSLREKEYGHESVEIEREVENSVYYALLLPMQYIYLDSISVDRLHFSIQPILYTRYWCTACFGEGGLPGAPVTWTSIYSSQFVLGITEIVLSPSKEIKRLP